MRLRALVITPNERTKDVGDILAIARAEAQKREHTRQNISIKVVKFVAELSVYVALYMVPDVREGKAMNL